MNRRKKKLIRIDLQFKVVFITLFVASFVLLINFQLLLAALWSFSGQIAGATSFDSILDEFRSMVIRKFLISLTIAVPLSITVAILYSFRFCGPIYRFKKYLTEMMQGARWDKPCGLRDGDQLTDLCDVINGAIAQLSSRVAASHEALTEVNRLLDESVLAADDATRARVRKVKEAIAAEDAVYQQRLGVRVSEATAEPESPEKKDAEKKEAVGVAS